MISFKRFFFFIFVIFEKIFIENVVINIIFIILLIKLSFFMK